MRVRDAAVVGARLLTTNLDLRESAARDAELLLLHTLSIERASLFAYPDRQLTPEEQARYDGLVDRRLRSEPIQYILGQQEFYGLLLRVTPAVLIPRPETEHLVETVLGLLPNDRPLRILDAGTGSGAIAIALAANLPLAGVTAVDLSPPALAVATENARRHDLQERIHFFQSDLLSSVVGQRFDAIVSNPPYIPEMDRQSLHPQVRDHEPALALFAGDKGMEVYERLIPQAHAALEPDGLLALEIGHGQREAIAALLSGWTAVSFVDDLQSIPRVAVAKRSF